MLQFRVNQPSQSRTLVVSQKPKESKRKGAFVNTVNNFEEAPRAWLLPFLSVGLLALVFAVAGCSQPAPAATAAPTATNTISEEDMIGTPAERILKLEKQVAELKSELEATREFQSTLLDLQLATFHQLEARLVSLETSQLFIPRIVSAIVPDPSDRLASDRLRGSIDWLRESQELRLEELNRTLRNIGSEQRLQNSQNNLEAIVNRPRP